MHHRQQTTRADARIVDEPVDRPELGAQVVDEIVQPRRVHEIERLEPNRPGPPGLGFASRRRQRVALGARDRDDLIAVRREPLRHSETEPAAAAGHDDVTHPSEPLCPRP